MSLSATGPDPSSARRIPRDPRRRDTARGSPDGLDRPAGTRRRPLRKSPRRTAPPSRRRSHGAARRAAVANSPNGAIEFGGTRKRKGCHVLNRPEATKHLCRVGASGRPRSEVSSGLLVELGQNLLGCENHAHQPHDVPSPFLGLHVVGERSGSFKGVPQIHG